MCAEGVPAVDPQAVLAEVRHFVELARAGSYIAGDRRVRPRERTQWRFTFKRLVSQSRDARRAGDGTVGVAALEALLDLAGDLRTYQYFRSEDAVGMRPGSSCRTRSPCCGGGCWNARGWRPSVKAMPRFIRWESRYGWTLRGYGKVAEKVALATVRRRRRGGPPRPAHHPPGTGRT